MESGRMAELPAAEHITEGQRYFFEANGYLVVPDALDPALLARVRAAADAAEARWRADASLPGVRRHDLEQVLGILEYDPVFLEVLEHPRIFPLVRELLGPDVMMLDHDYFLSPPGATVRRAWHYDEHFPGVYHPRSRLLVKVFYVLQDIPANGGATLILPGSHVFPPGLPLGNTEAPEDLPGAVAMTLPAGAAYLMAGRAYHSAGNNYSSIYRKLLILTYGHKWMRIWDTYEPSPALLARAASPMIRQLLGLADPYGACAPLAVTPVEGVALQQDGEATPRDGEAAAPLEGKALIPVTAEAAIPLPSEAVAPRSGEGAPPAAMQSVNSLPMSRASSLKSAA
jgi:ectoine hydroxylase